MFKRALPVLATDHSEFLAVLTLKMRVSATAFAPRKAKLRAELEEMIPGLAVTELHLFANTKHETTLVVYPTRGVDNVHNGDSWVRMRDVPNEARGSKKTIGSREVESPEFAIQVK